MKTIAKTDFSSFRSRVTAHLAAIYPSADAASLTNEVLAAFRVSPDTSVHEPEGGPAPWTEADILVITYGNSVMQEDERPLRTLRRFLDRRFGDTVTMVHLLPFFPYSSDDGFAVMDYCTVNQSLGAWEDITAMAYDFRIMADLVINHASSRSAWFENFKEGRDPGRDYFVTASPSDDLSQVVRPRTSPLLREIETPDGIRHVWCTFSHDQVDLDFKNPRVLMEFIAIIDLYMTQGITVFRLDAVAFLWKETCTACLHLPQTHEIIKLLRTLVTHRDPKALIITETNVPSKENLSYLGNGDEAHVIYSFPLPPLLLHTFMTMDSGALTGWLTSLPDQQLNTTCLNFIASHDGIGLRPVEGILTPEEVKTIISLMERSGGKVSTRALNDETANPYEINISLWNALQGTLKKADDGSGLQRFICAHAIMLALRGIPAFYIHSLVGTTNDTDRLENTLNNRAINRHLWDSLKLESLLDDDTNHHGAVYKRLSELMAIRKRQPAFHPNADQKVIKTDPAVVAIIRRALQGNQEIICLHNIANTSVHVDMTPFFQRCPPDIPDLISGTSVVLKQHSVTLMPYQNLWLARPLCPDIKR